MIDQEVYQGLNQEDKSISSKFFYDEVGGKIFQKITELPEYYLSRTEYEILESFCKNLNSMFSIKDMAMVELGSGASEKSMLLVNAFQKFFNDFYYCPLDVDKTRLQELRDKIIRMYPHLKVKPLVGDFFETLELAFKEIELPKIITFLGSSIGNFDLKKATVLMRNVSNSMTKEDYFLVGFDMVKDEKILYKAYNDAQGLTRDFNLNLLERFNRECGCDFNLNQFEHLEYFNSDRSAMESYLVSLKDQTVEFPHLNKKISFSKDERIHTEYSYKYTFAMISELAQKSNLKIKEIFTDNNEYFSSVLFVKA